MQLTITTPSASATFKPGLQGIYNVSVDWGDGSPVESFDNDSNPITDHVYETAGTYSVTITGSLERIGNGWTGIDFLQSVDDWDDITDLVSLAYAFELAINLTSVPSTLPNTITDLSYTFGGASSFNSDITSWDVSNVTTMNGLFEECSSFNQDISGWNVANVTGMNAMFRKASSFNQPIGSWNTASLTGISAMFMDATSFDQSLAGWDVSNLGQGSSAFSGIAMSVENYDALLISWASQTVQTEVSFSAGLSKYKSDEAIAAREFLINSRGWSITDNGFLDDIAPSWVVQPYIIEATKTTLKVGAAIDESGSVIMRVFHKGVPVPTPDQLRNDVDGNDSNEYLVYSTGRALSPDVEEQIDVSHSFGGGEFVAFFVAYDDEELENVQSEVFAIEFDTGMEGSGTALDPYQVKTPKHLDSIRNYLGEENSGTRFKIMNDIDLAFDTSDPRGLFYNDGAGWDPIGEPNSPEIHPQFEGVLDGNNHKITGLYINRKFSGQSIGLFSKTYGATIKNLGIEDSDIRGGLTGSDAAGSFVGELSSDAQNGGSTLEKCYVKNVSVSAHTSGLLVGSSSSQSLISKCYSQGDINGTTIGGIAGVNDGTIETCYSAGVKTNDGSGLPPVGGDSIESPTASISDLYYYGSDAGISGATAISSLDDMKLAATYVNLDIADYDDYVNELFKINNGHDYPILGWETPTVVTRTIGSTGGTVELTTKKAEIEIPASVLTEDKAISVSAKAETEPDTKYRRHTPVYKFGPDGTTFAQPVKVRFSLEGVDISGKTMSVFWSTETPGVYERVGGTIIDVEGVNYIEAEVDHFSEGFVSDVTEHTINFNTEYGSVDSVTVFDGFSIERPEDPVEPNMVLAYWYTEAPVDGVWDEEAIYDFDTPVISDLSLYARWVPEEETIDYQFGGWYTSETVQDDTTIWDFENDGMPAADVTLHARWIENPNLIKFVTNGGHAVSTREFQDDAEQYLLPEQIPHPWFEGHIFEGWYADEALTEPFDFSADPSVHQNDETPDDVTVYAKWSLESYTVIFNDATDKDEVPFANEVVTYGETIQTLTQPEPIKEGHKFVAWYTEAPVDEQWNEEARFNTTTMPDPNPQTEDTTTEFNLYARYEIEVYTIVYNTEHGVQPSDELVEWGQYVPDYTDDVIFEGHHIEGWYKDAEFTVPFDFTVPIPDPYEDIAEDSVINLYAKWVVDTYTINYNVGQDATVSKVSEEATFGSTLNAPSTNKVGYTLEGWYTTPSFDDSTKWTFDGESEPTTVYDKDPESHNNGDVIDLYAKWVVEQYTLAFDTTDGGSEITPVVCQYNQPYPVVSTPTKEGYTFAGWYTDAEYTDQISLGSQDDLVPDPNPGAEDFGTTITIYAKFSVNTYTVTFVNKGINNPYFENLIGDSSDEDGIGSPSFTELPVVFNTTFDGPEGMVQEGFTFEGWYTEDGTNFDRFEADGTWNEEAKWDHANDTMPANDITLYAHWSRNEHTITFVSNNGSTFEAIDVKFGDELGDSIVSTREGYSFKGWYTDNGTGLDDDLSGGTWDESDKWVFDTSLMPDADVTLYARWAINDYTVTFHANGGTFTSTGAETTTTDVTYGQYIPEPTPPIRRRFPFIDGSSN